MGVVTQTRVEWARGWLAVNHYRGCGHLCRYCYGRLILEKRFKKCKWDRPGLKEPLPEILGEVSRIRGKTVWLSSATDPYQPLERELKATREVLRVLRENNKIVVLTKSDLVLRDLDLLEGARVGLTVTSLEQNPWEPFAPPPGRRLRALRELKEAGVETFVSIEPWIPRVTEPLEIIPRVADHADWVILGRLNYAGARARFYRARLPRVLVLLDELGLGDRVLVKAELRRCLPSTPGYWDWALENLERWLETARPA